MKEAVLRGLILLHLQVPVIAVAVAVAVAAEAVAVAAADLLIADKNSKDEKNNFNYIGSFTYNCDLGAEQV